MRRSFQGKSLIDGGIARCRAPYPNRLEVWSESDPRCLSIPSVPLSPINTMRSAYPARNETKLKSDDLQYLCAAGSIETIEWVLGDVVPRPLLGTTYKKEEFDWSQWPALHAYLLHQIARRK